MMAMEESSQLAVKVVVSCQIVLLFVVGGLGGRCVVVCWLDSVLYHTVEGVKYHLL